MEFLVKLIILDYCPNSKFEDFIGNCTHVINKIYLYDGDVDYFIDNNIEVTIIDECYIESVGDLSKKQLRQYVSNMYNVSRSKVLDLSVNRCKVCGCFMKKNHITKKQRNSISYTCKNKKCKSNIIN
jgi:hypothetical protein